MCKYCNEPDVLGNYNPCCNNGMCYAIPSIGQCECCCAEMFEENGCWFHHSQADIPFDDRVSQGVVTS